MGTKRDLGVYTETVFLAEVALAASQKALRSLIAAAEGRTGDFQAAVAVAVARDLSTDVLTHLACISGIDEEQVGREAAEEADHTSLMAMDEAA